jgi:hypothetical protein
MGNYAMLRKLCSTNYVPYTSNTFFSHIEYDFFSLSLSMDMRASSELNICLFCWSNQQGRWT